MRDDVLAWLLLVATALGIAGVVFTITWKYVVLPHIKIYVLQPLEKVEAQVRGVEAKVDAVSKELHPNGGSSLRDRVDDTQRTAARAFEATAEQASLMAQHIEDAQKDSDRLVRVERYVEQHTREHGDGSVG